MKQVILQAPGKFFLADVLFNKNLSEGQALVKLQRIGICGTDLHAYRGKQPFFNYPRVLGHELGVEVLEVAENNYGVKKGYKCSIEPYINCGICIACKRGRTNCCTQMQVLGVHTDGGMQELMHIPVNKLHHSGRLTYDELALVETLAIGAHAVERAQTVSEDTILIIGAGPIGLAVTQFATLISDSVIVMDKDMSRLAFCREKMNVPFTLQADDNIIQSLQTLLKGDLPTLVFDATGNPESMMQAFRYVSHGGKLVFVGLFQGDVTFNDPEFHKRELTLLASRNATAKEFKNIIQLMESGKIDITPWITHRTQLHKVPEIFPQWLEPKNGVIKAMVEVV